MTKPLTHNELESLISIMKKMLVEANNSNWQALNRMDGERRTILQHHENSIQSTHVSNEFYADQRDQNQRSITELERAGIDDSRKSQETLNYRELVAKVVELDKKLISTVQDARQDLLLKKRQNTNQFKAKQGYAEASSLSLSHG
jgi:hypothetical protein